MSDFSRTAQQWSTDLGNWVNRWGLQEWFLAWATVLIIGAILLKGMGSRKHC